MHTIGQKVKLAATFAVGLTPVDPGRVTFRMEKPDGTVTPYEYGLDTELTKSSTGCFVVHWIFTQAGPHTYRWAGTEPCQASGEAFCEVAYSPFFQGVEVETEASGSGIGVGGAAAEVVVVGP